LTYATGFDAITLGQEFAKVAKHPRFFDSDHSKFDATILPDMLAIEHEIYSWFGIPKAARIVLEAQMMSRFAVHRRTPDGRRVCLARGEFTGKRNSGDPNTTVGNVLLNGLSKLFCACRSMGLDDPRDLNGRFEAIVHGDDLLVGHSDEFVYSNFVALHDKLGLRLKTNYVASVHRLTFCGSRPMHAWVDGQRMLVAVPQFERWAVKSGWTISDVNAEDYVGQFAQNWRNLLHDCPIYKHYIEKYLRHRPKRRLNHSDLVSRLQTQRIVKFSLDGDYGPAMYEFALSNGLTIEATLRIDQTLASVQDLPAMVDFGALVCWPDFFEV
jgi:hypothetical protein